MLKLSNRTLTILLLAFILFTAACKNTSQIGQEDSTSTEQVVSIPTEKSLLWKVEGKKLKEPSYVFGTIHMIDADKYFLPKGTEAALKQADTITFEIDMKEVQNPMVMLTMMSKMLMPDGITLKELLNEEDYKKVKASLDKNPSIAMMRAIIDVEKIKPLFLSSMVAEGSATGEIKSYEFELATLADKYEKETAGLETVEFQMSMFDSISYKDQAQMLVESLEMDPEEAENTMDRMIDLYLAQDINGLYQLINQEAENIGDFESLLLVKRNQNWIPIMMNSMRTGSQFYAVGAGHLGGKNGVIALLRQEGYKVTPVSQAP